MRYVVYEKKSGNIVRTYRRIIAESGEEAPADEDAILANLPMKLTRNEIGVLTLRELSFERGKSYKVDTKSGKIVSTDRDAKKRRPVRKN